jgi:hypothetical protein
MARAVRDHAARAGNHRLAIAAATYLVGRRHGRRAARRARPHAGDL